MLAAAAGVFEATLRAIEAGNEGPASEVMAEVIQGLKRHGATDDDVAVLNDWCALHPTLNLRVVARNEKRVPGDTTQPETVIADLDIRTYEVRLSDAWCEQISNIASISCLKTPLLRTEIVLKKAMGFAVGFGGMAFIATVAQSKGPDAAGQAFGFAVVAAIAGGGISLLFTGTREAAASGGVSATTSVLFHTKSGKRHDFLVDDAGVVAIVEWARTREIETATTETSGSAEGRP